MGLFLKILNRLHIHCMVQSISLLKINGWPDINVALFAIITEVCCFIMLCQNVKEHEKIVLMNIIVI